MNENLKMRLVATGGHMKSVKWMVGIGISIWIIISIACSIPTQLISQANTSTPLTPDITLTAIVAQLFVQATMTAEASFISIHRLFPRTQ
jgi:hypothetical protein